MIIIRINGYLKWIIGSAFSLGGLIAFFFAVFISVLLIKAMLIPSLQLFSLPGHINSSRLKTGLTPSNYHNTTNKDNQNKPKEGGLSNQAAMLISAD